MEYWIQTVINVFPDTVLLIFVYLPMKNNRRVPIMMERFHAPIFEYYSNHIDIVSISANEFAHFNNISYDDMGWHWPHPGVSGDIMLYNWFHETVKSYNKNRFQCSEYSFKLKKSKKT